MREATTFFDFMKHYFPTQSREELTLQIVLITSTYLIKLIIPKHEFNVQSV